MIAPWYLIIIITSAPQPGTAISKVPMLTQSACQAAVKKFRDTWPDKDTGVMFTYCIPTSDPKNSN